MDPTRQLSHPTSTNLQTKQRTRMDPFLSIKHEMGRTHPKKLGQVQPIPHGPRSKHTLSPLGT